MFGKMEELHGKKKIEYFLEYYGLETGILLLVVSFILFMMIHFMTMKECVSGVLAVNCDGIHPEKVEEQYFDRYLEVNGFDPEKNKITVNCKMHVSADYNDPVTRTNMQIINTMFATQAADVFLADEEFFVAIAQSDYLMDLRKALTQEELIQYEKDLVYAVNAVTQEEIVAGIRVTEGSDWLADTGWYQTGAVIGLTSACKSEVLATGLLRRAVGEGTK